MHKRRILALFSIFVFLWIGLAFATNASAASCGDAETSIINCNVGGDGGIYYVLSFILDALAVGVGITAVAGISWAGVVYLTAGENVSRVEKAKRRLGEIIIGLVCYTLIYVAASWLLPGAILSGDMTGVNNVAISQKDHTFVSKTFTPTVKFNDGAMDKTYSLRSSNEDILATAGATAKCVKSGKANLEVISANGKKSSTEIKCEELETVGSMMGTNLNGGPNLRAETQKIIDDHRIDFFYDNYGSKISQFGGYTKYVKSLGGVFTKFANKTITIKTAADLQAAAEYVWGLWTIWGVDYDNNRWHHSWRKGQAWNGGRNDGFYAGLWDRDSIHGYGKGNINSILSTSYDVRTNCNYALYAFLGTTSLRGFGSLHDYSGQISRSKAGKITNVSNLRVGDIVHYFGGGGNWNHITIVGEVYKDYVVMYDGGGRFVNSGSYKKITRRTNGHQMTNDYGSEWWAFRPWNIDQNITLRGIN